MDFRTGDGLDQGSFPVIDVTRCAQNDLLQRMVSYCLKRQIQIKAGCRVAMNIIINVRGLRLCGGSTVASVPKVFGKVGEPQQDNRHTCNGQWFHPAEKHTGGNHGKYNSQNRSDDKYV